MKQSRRAIVVVVDSLSAGFLGPYGNTWLDTPGVNRLAAESLLFDFAQTDSTDLELVYRSYWQGRHAADERANGDCLLEQLSAANMETALLTDEPEVAAFEAAARFDDHELLSTELRNRAAGDLSQTQLGQLFAAVLERIEQSEPASLLWIHSQGMSGQWDAPSELRNQFADEDDPLPGDFIEPPNARLEAGHDPDDVLRYTHAYGGQVAVLDHCIEAVLDALDATRSRQDTMLIFTSPRGYPLGQHGRVGTCDEALYGERIHVPLLVRYGDGTDAAVRSHDFVQPADLYAMLLDWFGLPGAAPIGSNDRALTVADGRRALRTPAWLLLQDDSHNELYVKPDDRWEANEVSARCADVAELAAAAADEYQQALNTDAAELPPLPDVLLEGLE